MNIPDKIQFVIKTIQTKYECFAVGGCVRDSIMGKTPKDYDITTNATPEEVKLLFDKTFDTGIQHGTVTVVHEKDNIEVTTYRIDGEYTDNRRPDKVCFTTDLVEDLRRRDYTMNAIAYNDMVGYVDPFCGVVDIENKVIRGVGEPIKRFEEDSLRIYRGVRFASQLGFEIESETLEAMKQRVGLTVNVSVERIRDELVKMLLGQYPDKLKYLSEIKILECYDECLARHYYKNESTIIENLKKVRKDTAFVLAVLMQNIDGDIKKHLTKLRVDNNTNKRVCILVDGVGRCVNNDEIYIRKMMSEYGEMYDEILELHSSLYGTDIKNVLEIVNDTKEKGYAVTIAGLNINGNDLKELGVQGKNIGVVLSGLLEEVIKNPKLNEIEVLKKMAVEIVGNDRR